jgi:hypothetical protein
MNNWAVITWDTAVPLYFTEGWKYSSEKQAMMA